MAVEVIKIHGKKYETIDGNLYRQEWVGDLDKDGKADTGLVPVTRFIDYLLAPRTPYTDMGRHAGYLRYSSTPDALIDATFVQNHGRVEGVILIDRRDYKK